MVRRLQVEQNGKKSKHFYVKNSYFSFKNERKMIKNRRFLVDFNAKKPVFRPKMGLKAM